jgi:hypothetical protein
MRPGGIGPYPPAKAKYFPLPCVVISRTSIEAKSRKIISLAQVQAMNSHFSRSIKGFFQGEPFSPEPPRQPRLDQMNAVVLITKNSHFRESLKSKSGRYFNELEMHNTEKYQERLRFVASEIQEFDGVQG